MNRTIICLGDSNTFGYDPTNYFGEPYDMPWPRCMELRTGDFVLNFGENGAEIPHRESDFYWLEKRLDICPEIDLITIMFGSNDLMLRGGDVSRITKRMERFLAFLSEKLPNTQLLLLAPPQLTGWERHLNQNCLELTEEYRRLAEREGILFADPKEWNLPLGSDGVHLTEGAHAIFAQEMEKLLKNATGPNQVVE